MFQSDLLGDLFGGAGKFATRTRDRTMVLRVSLRDLEGVDRALEVEPVSYTHPRAHETGRNLVCRLLLEKKKILYYFPSTLSFPHLSLPLA